MIERLKAQGVTQAAVLDALANTPRHVLVPDVLRHRAYENAPLPIGDGQTISAPDIVALMSQALELGPRDRVLEIGTGSGYQAAILSQLVARVVSIERIAELAEGAREALGRLGATNVTVHVGDGTLGWEANAPYEAIVVTAGGPQVPEPLLAQLAPGGRFVGPFGDRDEQQLVRIRRGTGGAFREPEVLATCRFVDLVGDHGWAA